MESPVSHINLFSLPFLDLGTFLGTRPDPWYQTVTYRDPVGAAPKPPLDQHEWHQGSGAKPRKWFAKDGSLTLECQGIDPSKVTVQQGSWLTIEWNDQESDVLVPEYRFSYKVAGEQEISHSNGILKIQPATPQTEGK